MREALIGQATVLRLLGSVTYTSRLSSADDPLHAAIGVYVISEEAFDQVAFMDPLADVQQGWYYWTFLTSSVQNFPGTVHFDIRTSRKLRQGYKLVAVANNPLNDEVSDITLNARALWSQAVA